MPDAAPDDALDGALADAPSRADWLRRLAPEKSEGGVSILQATEAARRVTRRPVLQRWLREAGYEAAHGMGGGGAMAEARAHGRMVRDLAERFPALVDAIGDATGGCGRLALHWRPLSPDYSKVLVQAPESIAFPNADAPDVFYHLREPTTAAVEGALRAVADALPRGAPFPSRPNTAAGVLGSADRCLGIELREYAGGDTSGDTRSDAIQRRVVLLLGEEAGGAADRDAGDERAPADAVRRIVAYFDPGARTSWYEE